MRDLIQYLCYFLMELAKFGFSDQLRKSAWERTRVTLSPPSTTCITKQSNASLFGAAVQWSQVADNTTDGNLQSRQRKLALQPAAAQ